jgi:prepilin-type processing-associated H-X9-DG protein/prepilin-type N-terminal cleavage/methylation domain-containing protein
MEMTRRRATRIPTLRSFTLVELLVVVAILGILAAILLPALQNAKEKGKAAVCVSNLRQVYTAFALYAHDWNGIVPPNKQYGADGWNYYWKFLGDPYLGSGQTYAGAANGVRYRILQCPGEKATHVSGQPASDPPTTMFDNPWAPSSYAMNFMINFGAWSEPAVTQFGQNTMSGAAYSATYLAGRVFDVSQVSFLMDCQRWCGWGWISPEYGFAADGDWPDCQSNLGSVWHAFRHPGKRANILYFDGHVGSARHYWEGGKLNWTWKYP